MTEAAQRLALPAAEEKQDWKRETAEAQKNSKKRGESQPSGARCVGRLSMEFHFVLHFSCDSFVRNGHHPDLTPLGNPLNHQTCDQAVKGYSEQRCLTENECSALGAINRLTKWIHKINNEVDNYDANHRNGDPNKMSM